MRIHQANASIVWRYLAIVTVLVTSLAIADEVAPEALQDAATTPTIFGSASAEQGGWAAFTPSRQVAFSGLDLVAATGPYSGHPTDGEERSGASGQEEAFRFAQVPEESTAAEETENPGATKEAETEGAVGVSDWHDEVRPDRLTLKIMPYAWVMGFDVDSTVAGVTVKLDLGIDDVLDDFDVIAFTNDVELRKGKWGAFLNLRYNELDGDFSKGPLDLGVVVMDNGADLHLRYLLVEKSFGQAERPRLFTLENLSGLRYRYLKQEINLDLGPFSLPTLGGSYDYVEPVIGGRMIFRINDRWQITTLANVGGFGIGSASDITFTWGTLFAYRFAKKWDFKFGGNFQYLDYSRGSGLQEFGMKGNFHGIFLGLAKHF